MNNPGKRPGARDISDLKARLGLKKGGAKAAPESGVAPPPGIQRKKPGSTHIPAPPGASNPTPYPTQTPSASDDPFGAMNSMAGAPKTAPDIVVVNDGNVERIAEQGKGRFVKLAALMLIPLVVGAIIGKIGQSANVYNSVIEDAKTISDDIKKTRSQIDSVRNTLLTAKERGAGGQGFLLNDAKLTTDLSALEAIPLEREAQVYGSNLYSLPDTVVAEILGFYADVRFLNESVKAHVDKSTVDAKVIASADEEAKKLNPLGFAGLLNLPKDGGGAATVSIVQIGQMVCEDGSVKPNCGGARPKGFQYRVDQNSATTGTKNLAAISGENVSGNSLLPIDTNGTIFKQLIRGGEASVAETAYMKRVNALETLTQTLLERGKVIQEVMNKKATESKKFSFFM